MIVTQSWNVCYISQFKNFNAQNANYKNRKNMEINDAIEKINNKSWNRARIKQNKLKLMFTATDTLWMRSNVNKNDVS